MDNQTLQTYQSMASDFAADYRRLTPTRLYESIKSFFHPAGVTADIGCGSGRDVAWLAAEGFPATGYDASQEMLAYARSEYPNLSFQSERLPDLAGIANAAFDNVLCSATIMHLRREDLITAVINLSRILKPNGRLVLSYRGSRISDERESDGRLFTAIPPGKLILLLESAGFRIAMSERRMDIDRPDIWWTVILAEKGLLDRSRGLERVQNILVQDAKSATYKFALIRAFCQIARTQPHVVRWGVDCVYVPLWDVAVRWLSSYWPLITAPVFIAQNNGETPGSSMPIAFRAAVLELATIYGPSGLWAVLRDIQLGKTTAYYCLKRISQTIKVGPVTFSGGLQNRAFAYASKAADISPVGTISPFGWIRVPESIWLDISRFDHWIEDSIVMRWAALSARMNPGLTIEQIIPYLVSSPGDERDTTAIRAVLLNSGQPLYCVWTGRLIKNDLHVDHAIPFSVWNNNDYWNLLPCNNAVNMKKSDSLPTQSLIKERSDVIVDYWRLYRRHFVHSFDQQISGALGCRPGGQDWEVVALSGLKETVQRISATRGLKDWAP